MRVLFKICLWTFWCLLLLLLPVALLLRGSLYFFQHVGLHTWVGLAAGGFLTFLLLLVYLCAANRKIFGRFRISKGILLGKAGLAALLILAVPGYALVSVSGTHVKAASARQEFRSLHPYLRLGVGIVLLVDRDLLITDMARSREEYVKMGLRAPRRSLHYPQRDGFVYAMDLRTRGRNTLRNGLLAWYFRLMGFNVLRRVGTADHLHISISPRERPGAV